MFSCAKIPTAYAYVNAIITIEKNNRDGGRI
jgi:hypothetical protein